MPLKGRIDLRSDTFTEPTAAMRKAMATCEVGDDVWDLDPTVKELEDYAASIFGKDAALFVPSSVMANLIAVMAHTTGRSEEIIVGDRSHISLYEQGNVSTIGGVHVRTVKNFDDGTMELDEVERKVRPLGNVHFPKTSLICIESSHNMCSGSALPFSFIEDISKVCSRHDIKLHMDGARVFNSATALKTDVGAYTKSVDSVTVCLSKGLAAPIGSLLIGSKGFIVKSKQLRKALGGGMRQAGVIACCGLIALKEMSLRLEDDHANAKRLFEILSSIPGILVRQPDTNIVKFALEKEMYRGVNLSGLAKYFEVHNIFMITVDEGAAIRAVVHYHITREDIETAGSVISSVLGQVRCGQLVIPNGNTLY
jgi:threonine aldolase